MNFPLPLSSPYVDLPAALQEAARDPGAQGSAPPYIDLSLALRISEGWPDPLGPGLARAFGAGWVERSGLFPLRLQGDRLWVATVWPMRGLGQRILRVLSPESVVLYRTDREAMESACRALFGNVRPLEPTGGRRPRRFGHWVTALGKASAEAVNAALEQQRQEGGRLGEILVGHGQLSSKDVAEVLGQQYGLEVVDLLARPPAADRGLSRVWNLFPETFWRRHRLVPVAADGVIAAAMEDPLKLEPLLAIARAAQRPVRPLVTGHRDIEAALHAQFGTAHLLDSRDRLWMAEPAWSARRLLSPAQSFWLTALTAATALGVVFGGPLAGAIVSSCLTVAYTLLVGYRWWMIQQGVGKNVAQAVSEDALAALDARTLPVYTVLVPVRDEASVMPSLAAALERIDWPKHRLDVKLLIEQDDTATLAAARAARLPAYVDIVVIPPAEPRTKPKACNFGLARARGEFLTIFDAEDIPDPKQLKKAYAVFLGADPGLACVQAKLTYFNANQNWLTRWFTAEYAAWFDLYLPAIHAAGQPVPLGGTSNHFRVSVLRQLGGWDPYNVTEDADLGIRLHRAGYRTTIVDAYTLEEANSELVNWVRQRSRWVKGYLQTWLVHMRHPRTLWQELGPGGFWGFQAALLGTVLPFVLNPLYWVLTSLWFMTQWSLIPRLFPPGIYYLGMTNLLLGNFLFAYMNLLAVVGQRRWELAKYSLLMPVYWGMMSLAAWKALLQIVTRPSHWEKTRHGLATEVPRYPPQSPAAGQAGSQTA